MPSVTVEASAVTNMPAVVDYDIVSGLVTIGHSAEHEKEPAEFADRIQSRRKPLDELVRYETWSPPV